MRHRSAKAVSARVTDDPSCRARGPTGRRACLRGKSPLGRSHTVPGTGIRLRSFFRFLWTAQPRIYAADRQAGNHKPVMLRPNKERTCGYRRASSEPDRNDQFRSFRSPQSRRIRLNAPQSALPGRRGDARAHLADGNRLGQSPGRRLRAMVSADRGRKTPMEQGVE